MPEKICSLKKRGSSGGTIEISAYKAISSLTATIDVKVGDLVFVFANGGRTVSVTGGEFLAKINCIITSSYGGVLHMYKATATSFTYTVSGSSGYSTYIVVSD